MSDLNKPDLNKPVFKNFPEMAKNIKNDLCAVCTRPILKEEFTSENTIFEYSISGMCPNCQNELFEIGDIADLLNE